MKHFLLNLAMKTGIFNRINLTRTKYVNGNRIEIPIIKGMGLNNLSISEKWMIECLKKYIKIKAGIFIDIGVNLGQTLIKVKCVDPTIEYIGLEPNPLCVFYVKQLIKQNRFKNCTILPVGVFINNSLVELDIVQKEEWGGGSSIIRKFRQDQKIYYKQYVPVFTFEKIAETFGSKRISFIKIDVEGAELEVINSLSKSIKTFRPIIFIEILPVYSLENTERKERQDKIEQIILELDYKMLRVVKSHDDTYKGLQEIKTIGIHSDIKQCDYIFVPDEVKEEILKESIKMS